MARSTSPVWLLIRDLTPEEWLKASGPSLMAVLKGEPLPRISVPGLLFGLPHASAGARAAIQAHLDIRNAFSARDVPPMVIDAAGDPVRITALARNLERNMIVATAPIFTFLASEPIEMSPGPVATAVRGEQTLLKLLPITSHNIGWALPSLSLAAPPRVKATEPAVINIHMDSSPGRLFSRMRKIPWVAGIVITLGAFFLMGAYRSLKRMGAARRASQPPPISEMTPSAELNSTSPLSADTSFLAPADAEAVAPAPGFGTVVIQTNPPEAQIYLNEELVSKKSPVTLERQSNQNVYTLTVKKKGFETYTGVYNIGADERKVIDIRLSRNVARVEKFSR